MGMIMSTTKTCVVIRIFVSYSALYSTLAMRAVTCDVYMFVVLCNCFETVEGGIRAWRSSSSTRTTV